MTILGLPETWIRNENDRLCEAVDETTSAPAQPENLRGYSQVAVIAIPILPYRVMGRGTSPTVQWVTMEAAGITLTTIFMIPRDQAGEEHDLLNGINRKGGS